MYWTWEGFRERGRGLPGRTRTGGSPRRSLFPAGLTALPAVLSLSVARAGRGNRLSQTPVQELGLVMPGDANQWRKVVGVVTRTGFLRRRRHFPRRLDSLNRARRRDVGEVGFRIAARQGRGIESSRTEYGRIGAPGLSVLNSPAVAWK